jgi:hypothetical protein
MIQCPNCQHDELAGAIFCSECGAQLPDTATLTTHSIKTGGIEADWVDTAALRGSLAMPASTVLSLQILDSGEVLPLTERDEFTLGRVSEGQPIMPDIDLSSFNGYQLGVSRLHAVLKKQPNNEIVIVDLGSSNGTYLNGTRLKPHEPQKLAHSDIVSLGRLKIQVLFP